MHCCVGDPTISWMASGNAADTTYQALTEADDVDISATIWEIHDPDPLLPEPPKRMLKR